MIYNLKQKSKQMKFLTFIALTSAASAVRISLDIEESQLRSILQPAKEELIMNKAEANENNSLKQKRAS